MKKVKKTVSILLSVFMLASMCVVSASAANEKTLEVSNPFSKLSVTIPATADDGLADLTADKAASDVEKELKVGFNLTYNQDNRFGSSSYAGLVIPITVSTEGNLTITATPINKAKDATVRLYTDVACTSSVSYKSITVDDILPKNTSYYLPKAGTYYMEIESWNSSYSPDVFENKIKFETAFYPSADTTIEPNKQYRFGFKDYDVTDACYKITMPSSGYLNLYSDTSVDYAILDKDKLTHVVEGDIDSKTDFVNTMKLAKGDYYIRVKSGFYDVSNYMLKYMITNEPSLKKGQYVAISPASTTSEIDMKFKASKNGYVTIDLLKEEGCDNAGYVTLLNSKKKVVSEKEWLYAESSSSYKAVFGVKKGQTYYLRMSDISDKAKVRYNETAVSEKSGKTRKKAVKLVKNKFKKGTIAAGEKKSDYYKITIKKAQKFKVQMKGDSSGTIYAQFYNSKGKKINSAFSVVYGINTNKTVYTLTKFSKGSYYVRIYGENAKSSGHYSIKLK